MKCTINQTAVIGGSEHHTGQLAVTRDGDYTEYGDTLVIELRDKHGFTASTLGGEVIAVATAFDDVVTRSRRLNPRAKLCNRNRRTGELVPLKIIEHDSRPPATLVFNVYCYRYGETYLIYTSYCNEGTESKPVILSDDDEFHAYVSQVSSDTGREYVINYAGTARPHEKITDYSEELHGHGYDDVLKRLHADGLKIAQDMRKKKK